MPIVTHYSTRESADRLRFASLDGTIRHLRKRGIKPVRRGRLLLWPAKAIDAILRPDNSDSKKEGAK